MLVSVIMPTYNNEREIGLAVASVLLQDFKDFELIVVNDASTDATPEILERLAVQDDRIVLLNNERNLGRARSRNRAIEIARSDLIAILDADDIAMPHRLSRQVAYMQKHADVGILGAWVIRIDTHNRPIDLLVSSTQDADLRRQSRWRMSLGHNTIMFRREAIVSAGMYNPKFIRSEDVHLYRRVIQRVKAACLPEFLLLYRLDTALRPEHLRGKYRWSAYVGWDGFKDSPSLAGLVSVARLLLLSCLPAPVLTRLAGIHHRNPLPSEEQRTEIRGWIRRLENMLETADITAQNKVKNTR